ncbi:hypothetical protein ACFLZZ_02985 [Nanoarchaeota archaeon]
MLLKLNDPKAFSDAISIMSELVNEVRIKVNKGGMSAVAVDPANVALVSLKLPHSAFSQFESEEEELCVNLDDLKQVLKRAQAGGSLTLEKNENKLVVTMQDTVKRKFTLSLINLEAEEKQIPELDFQNKVLMPSNLFQHAIEDAAIVSDACTLETKENAFAIEAKGNLNSSCTTFNSDEAKFSGEGKSRYSLEYLQKFVKGGKLADNVYLQYHHAQHKSEYPLRVDFLGNVELTFILAPRVEED